VKNGKEELPRKSREDLHRLIDSLPDRRVTEAYDTAKRNFLSPPARQPGTLPSFVGMIRSGDPDSAEKARRRLHEGEKDDEGNSERNASLTPVSPSP